MPHKAIFLDRDGTITKDVHYCSHPEDLELLPNAAEAIRLLNEHRYKVVIVTNQSGIGRGYFTEEALAEIHEKMKSELAKEGALVDAIYYCSHHPDENCDCRKPKPKLILQAAKEYHIALDYYFVVGDMQMDIEMGKAVGCQAILIGTPLPAKDWAIKPDIIVPDLLEAAQTILEGV